MKVLEYKWNPNLSSDEHWVPMLRTFGSNIKGLRFKPGSVQINAVELEAYVQSHSDIQDLRNYLQDIQHCYKYD